MKGRRAAVTVFMSAGFSATSSICLGKMPTTSEEHDFMKHALQSGLNDDSFMETEEEAENVQTTWMLGIFFFFFKKAFGYCALYYHHNTVIPK